MIKLIGIFVVGIIFGITIGILLGNQFKRVDGEIIVDDSDGEVTRWKLCLKSNVDNIPNKKRLIFITKILP